MSTIIPLAAILLLSLCLGLRALARRKNQSLNAAMLAQLEAMESSLDRMESESAKSDREIKKLERRLNPSRPKPMPTPIEIQPSPSPAASSNDKLTNPQPSHSTPSAPPQETTNPNPPRKRGKRPPQTLEEYEAIRKPLPPSPVYKQSSRAEVLFDKMFATAPPYQSTSNIAVNPRSSVVENAPTPKQSLLTLCLSPLRLAARCVYIAIRPVLLFRPFAAGFFARPKPPSLAEGAPQNFAA